MKNHMIVGITGGIGCGKSTVTDLFGAKGIKIVDADIVAREVVEVGTKAISCIAAKFGSDILLADGSLNRAKLRQIIFNDNNAKLWLETLLHPIIRSSIIDQLNCPITEEILGDNSSSSSNLHYTLLSSPLLLETDQHTMTDLIIIIDLELETQINRAMLRDNNCRSQIERIISNQIPRADRLDKADIVINNDGTLEQLSTQVDKIHSALITKAANYYSSSQLTSAHVTSNSTTNISKEN